MCVCVCVCVCECVCVCVCKWLKTLLQNQEVLENKKIHLWDINKHLRKDGSQTDGNEDERTKKPKNPPHNNNKKNC